MVASGAAKHSIVIHQQTHKCSGRPQANAESLAGALRNIIEARRVQQNFQLIVITHDEKCAPFWQPLLSCGSCGTIAFCWM